MAKILTFREGRNSLNPPDVNAAGSSAIAAYKEVGVPNRKKASIRDRWLRIQAVQVVTMLPDDAEEAERVLEYARSILTEFVEPRPVPLNVVKRD